MNLEMGEENLLLFSLIVTKSLCLVFLTGCILLNESVSSLRGSNASI